MCEMYRMGAHKEINSAENFRGTSKIEISF
jgi:hypothetical protein